MIEFLEVNNIALIANETIEFDNGLNVITGETGAGKSLLINSIGILLGGKLDKNLIRQNEEQCKICAKFFVEDSIKQNVDEFCQKYDIEQCDEFIVTRSYNIKGRNDIKINGQIVTLNILKEFTSIFIDSYFQNDNQKIFDKNQHLQILDQYNHTEQMPEFAEYQIAFDKLNDIKTKMQTFGINEADRQIKLDILLYQLNEIKTANLSTEEYNDLVEKKLIMTNVGKIVSNTNSAYNCLNTQTLENIYKAKSSIGQAIQYDESLNDIYNRLDSIKIELDDIVDSLDIYNQKYDFSETEQQQIEDRIDLYKKIFRKYAVNNIDELTEKSNKIEIEIDELQNANEKLEELKNEYKKTFSKLIILGEKIHNSREKSANILSKKIQENISNLGMKNGIVKFRFEIIDYENPQLYKNGLDKVELLFSANLGEEPKELEKTASGGEISRFMLALKAEISSSENASTIIFDEIDTGISGVAVEQVAKYMAKISKTQQVIVVTHSAQICAMADTNYFIKKSEKDGKTSTQIKKLNYEQKIDEVARFLSGDTVTETSIANAKELIELQENYKKTLTNNSSI